MRKIKGILLIILSLFGFLFLNQISFTIATNDPNNSPNPLLNNTLLKVYQLQQLQEDFNALKTIIDYFHPQYFTNKQELDDLFTNQYQLLTEDMSELDFFRILAPIVAKLNCGHTQLRLSQEYQDHLTANGIFFPLEVRIIDDKAYILRDFSEVNFPAGAEIIEINGQTIVKIISILLDNIPLDGWNVSRKYYRINAQFGNLFYNFVDASENFSITYVDPNNQKSHQITLPGIKTEHLKRLKSNSPKSEPYSEVFEKDYAVLTIRSFSFYQKETRAKFMDFIDKFFNRVAERKLTNVILDLRNNGGGDPYCSSYVFSHLTDTAYPYFAEAYPMYRDLAIPVEPNQNNFTGNLYTLINGGCFSTTGHLCSLLKYHKVGIFIGDETGGSYICTDGSRDVVLKNTRLRLHYSTKAYQTAVTGLKLGRGVMPDYYVLPTIQDYINGEDAEKEYAIKLIK